MFVQLALTQGIVNPSITHTELKRNFSLTVRSIVHLAGLTVAGEVRFVSYSGKEFALCRSLYRFSNPPSL